MVEKEESKVKLMVGIPTLGNLSMATYASLPNLKKGNIAIELHFSSKTPLDNARNTIIERFLASDNTHLLFIDSDILIPRNIYSLLERDVDVVSGLYGLWKEGIPVLNIFEKTHERGLYRAIDRFKRGELIEIDGCGLGCFLVKRRVIEKLSKPWCSFSSWDEEKQKMYYAEDFHLCDRIRKAGIKIHADTSVMCSHIVKMDIAEVTTYIGSRVDRELVIEELKDYTGKTKEEVYSHLKYSTERIATKWKELNPKTEKEINDFYKNVTWYIYDLAGYNSNPSNIIKREEIASKAFGKILDYGAGIGTYLIDCYNLDKKDLTYVDLKGKTWTFAEWRFKKRGMQVKMLEPNELKGKYNSIFLLDMLEHLLKWKKVLKQLVQEHLEENGILFLTETISKKEGKDKGFYPQHFTLERGEVRKYLDKLLKGRKITYYLWEMKTDG